MSHKHSLGELPSLALVSAATVMATLWAYFIQFYGRCTIPGTGCNFNPNRPESGRWVHWQQRAPFLEKKQRNKGSPSIRNSSSTELSLRQGFRLWLQYLPPPPPAPPPLRPAFKNSNSLRLRVSTLLSFLPGKGHPPPGGRMGNCTLPLALEGDHPGRARLGEAEQGKSLGPGLCTQHLAQSSLGTHLDALQNSFYCTSGWGDVITAATRGSC